MKFFRARSASTVILSLLLVTSATLPALAAGTYVDGGADTLPGSLNDAYAVGGDGSVEKITGNYAITARGIEQITGGSTTDDPNQPPQEAPIWGTVRLPFSTVKIGLKYYYSAARDSSVDSAALYNSVGSGYRLGYYNENRSFIELGTTAETSITMVRDTNVSLTAGALGCYHILLPGAYGSFSEAKYVASAYADGFPAFYNGLYYALVGHYQSESAAANAASSRGITGTAFSASSRCVVVTKTDTTSILFEFDCGDTFSLGVQPIETYGKAVTNFNGTGYYGGFEFRRVNGGKLTVISVVDMDDYIMGVISMEMSYLWPLEALKAQALCARSYAARFIKSSIYYDIAGFDLTNDGYSQSYVGTSRLGTNGRIADAVYQTSGQYMVYNGSLISAMYSSSSGGGTEDNVNVNGTEVPYLKGVLDPYEAAAADINSKNTWTVTYTAAQLGAKVGMSNIVWAEPTYSATNNCVKLILTDLGGSVKTIQRDSCRTTLGLDSIHYTVTRNSDGSFTFNGGGWGHNVGMSQYGAYAMALHYGFNYRQIVGFYYTGINIAYAES